MMGPFPRSLKNAALRADASDARALGLLEDWTTAEIGNHLARLARAGRALIRATGAPDLLEAIRVAAGSPTPRPAAGRAPAPSAGAEDWQPRPDDAPHTQRLKAHCAAYVDRLISERKLRPAVRATLMALAWKNGLPALEASLDLADDESAYAPVAAFSAARVRPSFVDGPPVSEADVKAAGFGSVAEYYETREKMRRQVRRDGSYEAKP